MCKSTMCITREQIFPRIKLKIFFIPLKDKYCGTIKSELERGGSLAGMLRRLLIIQTFIQK